MFNVIVELLLPLMLATEATVPVTFPPLGFVNIILSPTCKVVVDVVIGGPGFVTVFKGLSFIVIKS